MKVKRTKTPKKMKDIQSLFCEIISFASNINLVIL
jgi:hypothetical protein